MSELNIVLKYKGFNEEFESLKEVKLLNLPNEIDEFVNRVEIYEANPVNKVDYEINRYHLYNEIFTELRHKAALTHFKENVKDLIIGDDRIIKVYMRLEEDWVSNCEDATDEVNKFHKFTNLLAL